MSPAEIAWRPFSLAETPAAKQPWPVGVKASGSNDTGSGGHDVIPRRALPMTRDTDVILSGAKNLCARVSRT